MKMRPNRLLVKSQKRVRAIRWRTMGAFLIALLMGGVLILLGALNLRSARTTAEQARQGRALDLTVQAGHSVRNAGRPASLKRMRKLLRNVTGGPVSEFGLLNAQGRMVLSSHNRSATDKTQHLLSRMRSQGKTKAVAKRRGGDRPTYEVILLFRSRIPGGIDRRHRLRLTTLLGGKPPFAGPEWSQRIYFRAIVIVDDAESRRALRDAWRAHVIGLIVVGLLLIMAAALFLGDRRVKTLLLAMQRQQVLAEMGEMAAVLAHEIRNPLGILKGNAQLLLEEDEDPTREALCSLVDQSSRLERLVNELLEFARPVPPVFCIVKADSLVESACEMVANEAVAKQVAVVSDLRPGTLRADADQIQRALVNVLRNALQASPERTTVTISLRFSGGHARMSVLDSGPGLPASLGCDIFKPFVTTRQSGSGLGLAIVRRILEAHGGRIESENVPNHGARLVLVLPVDGPSDVEDIESAMIPEDSSDEP